MKLINTCLNLRLTNHCWLMSQTTQHFKMKKLLANSSHLNKQPRFVNEINQHLFKFKVNQPLLVNVSNHTTV